MITINPRDDEVIYAKRKLWGFMIVRNVRPDLTQRDLIANDAVIGIGRYKGTECRIGPVEQKGRKLHATLRADEIVDKGK